MPTRTLQALNKSATQGFVQEDFDLMVGDWGSSYVMVDAVGLQPTYPHDYWHAEDQHRTITNGRGAAFVISLASPCVQHDPW